MIVHAIVVTYNGAFWIKNCIESLQNSTVSLKISVVDNVSTDNTVEIIRRYFPNVNLIVSSENLGFGKANNIAMRQAYDEKADYVFLLNQDAWIDSGTIKSLIEIHRNDPGYGVLSPVHLNGKGDAFDFKFAEYCEMSRCPGFSSDTYLGTLKDVYEISFVNAAFWLVSRECIETVGVFDPLFPHYGEDLDYLNRVKYFGMRVGITPHYRGYHDREYRPYSEYRERTMRKLGKLCILKDIRLSYKMAIVNVLHQCCKDIAKRLAKLNFRASYHEFVVLVSLAGELRRVRAAREISTRSMAFLKY